MLSSPEAGRGALVAVALAVVLRVPHGLVRWEETAWRYAAYPAETLERVREGDLAGVLGTFTGLHPPLWPVLHSLLELWAPVPLLWLSLGVACSVGAVAITAREHPAAGLLLAASPIQVHYCAEVNQYPLALLWVAGAWSLAGRGRSLGLGLLVALAGWTHLLAGVVAGLAALRLPRRAAAKTLGLAAVLLLPLAWPILSALGDEATFRQPALSLVLVAADWRARFGLAGAAVVGLAALGSGRRPRVALGVAASLALLGSLIGARIAAPHQFPYLLFVGPPLAILGAAGLGRLGERGGLVLGLLAAVLAGGVLRLDLSALGSMAGDPPRAVDRALAEVERPWTCGSSPAASCSGDALVLLSPPGTNDDDKRQHSATLWRLRPWTSMPKVVPPGIDWSDHRQGHPRKVGDHVVYVFDHPREALPRVLQAHERVWLVVYDQGQNHDYTERLAEELGRFPTEVGGDHLYRLSGQTSGADSPVVQDAPAPG